MHCSRRALRPCLCSIFLFLLLIAVPMGSLVQAQQAEGSFDSTFLPNGPLRTITEPLFLGEASFAHRLAEKTGGAREPLALVLCGGSARAYAHIGVLKALEAADIEPDFIVANSMGAIVGMLYAAGFSPDDIELLVSALSPEHYLDIVFPTHGGFITMNRFIAVLDMLMGSMDLSETRIPIIIIGEDLRTRRQVWFAEGGFSRIMAGAIAMPAIFEPQPIEDFLIIDGGSTNIVPLEPALRFTSSIIVSTALYNRRMNFSNPITVINRAFDIGKTRAGIEALARSNALIIRNRVEELSYMQFSDPEQIIRIGEESAVQALRFFDSTRPAAPEDSVSRSAMHARLVSAIAAIRTGVRPNMPLSLRIAPRLVLAPPFIHVPGSLQEFPHAGMTLKASVWRMDTAISYLALLSPTGTRQWVLDSAFNINPAGSLEARFSARLWGAYDGSAAGWHVPSMYEFSTGLQASGIIGRRKAGFNLEGAYLESFSASSSAWEARGGFFIEPEYEDTAEGESKKQPSSVPWFSLEAGGFAESSLAEAVAAGVEGSLWAGVKNASFAPRMRANTRVSLSGVPFRETEFDGFRGAVTRSDAMALVIANAELALAPRKYSVDFAESILLKNFELAPFLDIKWKADETHALAFEAWAGGLCFSVQASAFGLAPAQLSMLASVNSSGAFTFQLRAGALFPTRR